MEPEQSLPRFLSCSPKGECAGLGMGLRAGGLSGSGSARDPLLGLASSPGSGLGPRPLAVPGCLMGDLTCPGCSWAGREVTP
jgi:hypothetical protein